MNKILLVMCLSLATMGGAVAQKLVIKKSVVYVDKSTDPLASIERVDGKTYIYKNPQGENVFKLEEKLEQPRSLERFHYILVTDLRNNKTNAIPYDDKVLAFGNETILFHNITKGDYILMTDKGIDYNSLDSLMNGVKRDVPERIKTINDSIQNVIDKGLLVIKERNVSINTQGEVLGNGQLIGLMKYNTNKNGISYEFYDVKGKIKVAHWQSFNSTVNLGGFFEVPNPGYKMLTYNRKLFVIDKEPSSEKKKSGDYPGFAMEMLAILYANDIDIAKIDAKSLEEARAALEEERRLAKENDANIRSERGYVIDPKGNKIEGNISVIFDDGKPVYQGIDLLGGLGSKVVIEYQDDKGKNKTSSFKASDNVSFRINLAKNGTVEQYDGFKYDIANKTLGFINKLGTGAIFFKHVYGDRNLGVYLNPISNEYVIKLKTAKNGYGLMKDTDDMMVKGVLNYLNCETLNLEGSKLYSLEGLKKLVDDYDAQCQ